MLDITSPSKPSTTTTKRRYILGPCVRYQHSAQRGTQAQSYHRRGFFPEGTQSVAPVDKRILASKLSDSVLSLKCLRVARIIRQLYRSSPLPIGGDIPHLAIRYFTSPYLTTPYRTSPHLTNPYVTLRYHTLPALPYLTHLHPASQLTCTVYMNNRVRPTCLPSRQRAPLKGKYLLMTAHDQVIYLVYKRLFEPLIGRPYTKTSILRPNMTDRA